MNKANLDHTLSGEHNHNNDERDLLTKLQDSQVDFHAAMCDSFDTTRGLECLSSLVTTANIYINSRSSIPNTAPLEAIAIWVTRILRMFGLGEGSGTRLNGKPEIGWGEVQDGDSAATNVSRLLQARLPRLMCIVSDCRKRLYCYLILQFYPNSVTRLGNKAEAIEKSWNSAIGCEMKIWSS